MNALRKYSHFSFSIVISLAVLMNMSFASLNTGSRAKATAGTIEKLDELPGFAKGFDASYVKRVEDKGGVYRNAAGQVQDIFQILAANGVTYVRFRVWNNPPAGYCSPADVLALALRAKAAGLKILLDFHYSDGWADPGQQTKPAAWNTLDFRNLNRAVFDFSRQVVSAMIRQGTPPDIVEVGNEITHGMLWPDGHVIMGDATYDTPGQWRNFTSLLQSAILGVKAARARAKIMIHIASADDTELRWFFDHLKASHVNYDIMGLSYYYLWHGTISQMSANLDDMATRYRKPIIIAETSYPFTLGWNYWTNNVIGLESQLSPDYPATPAGQTAFLQGVVDMTRAIPHHLGIGVFYWGGEWIATSPQDPDGSTWENQALFDFNSTAVDAFSVFRNTR